MSEDFLNFLYFVRERNETCRSFLERIEHFYLDKQNKISLIIISTKWAFHQHIMRPLTFGSLFGNHLIVNSCNDIIISKNILVYGLQDTDVLGLSWYDYIPKIRENKTLLIMEWHLRSMARKTQDLWCHTFYILDFRNFTLSPPLYLQFSIQNFWFKTVF